MASPKRENEARIFAGFRDIRPEFSGEPLAKWNQPEQENDFPDIIGETVSGRRVGIELGEWLNAKQIAEGIEKERREESIYAAVGEPGDQETNPTTHIDRLWLSPKGRVPDKDRAEFRKQLFSFIEACDDRWPNEPYWQRGTNLGAEDLKEYSVLGKYLGGVKLFAKREGNPWSPNWWILFPNRGMWFDRNTMLNPLRQLIASKTAHYTQSKTGFDHLSLLLYHDRAAFYNSPYATPLHPEETIIEAAKEAFGDSIAPFDRVFLYITTEAKAYQLR